MKEIDRRRSMAGELQARRAELERELDSVNTELAQLESLDSMYGNVSAAAPARGRPKGSGKSGECGGRGGKPSLASVLRTALQGKTMIVAQMAEAAKKAGHKSKSRNLNTVVGLTLLNHKKMFKRVSRGMYTAN